MKKDKGILGVVPARSGSKAVNLKDLRPVLRVPVVARVGEVVAQVPMIAGVVVSPADAPIPGLCCSRPYHRAGPRKASLAQPRRIPQSEMSLFKKFGKAFISRLPHRPRKRLLRLVSIKDYPAYLGRTVVPDTFFWAKLCFDVAKILFRRDYRRRRGLVARVSQSTDDRIPPDKAYLLKDLSSNQVVVRAIEFCRDPALRRRLMERAQTAKKPFLITLPIDLRQESNKPILELACDNALLGPISEYIGMIPVLQYAQLSYSPNVEYYGRSQMFHLDGGDYRLVKCYVFVDEVDLGSGPLTIIPAVESRKIYDRLRQRGMTRQRNKKFDDDTIYSVSDLKAGVPLVGKSGIVAFVDTCRCYHFGSRPGSKPRWLLYLFYYSPYSMELPLWGRRYDPAVLAMNKGHKDKELRDLVLGLSHLNFVELRMTKQLGQREDGGS